MVLSTQYIDDYRIRPATLDDIAAVMAAYHADEGIHVSFQVTTEAYLLEPGAAERDLAHDAWVAETFDGYIIATADVSSDDDGNRISGNVAVNPDYAGQGLEHPLLALVEARARELAARTREGDGSTLELHSPGQPATMQALLEDGGYAHTCMTWELVLTIPTSGDELVANAAMCADDSDRVVLRRLTCDSGRKPIQVRVARRNVRRARPGGKAQRVTSAAWVCRKRGVASISVPGSGVCEVTYLDEPVRCNVRSSLLARCCASGQAECA